MKLLGKHFRTSTLILVLVIMNFSSGCEQTPDPSEPTGTFYYFRLLWNSDASSEATVAWSSTSDADAQVLYYDTVDHGEDVGAYSYYQELDVTRSAYNMNNHFVRLKNLEPATKYYFVVANDEDVSRRYWFETSSDDSDDPISIIAGGDSRNNHLPRVNANQLVRKLKPHAVLFGGDMTDNGTEKQWKRWLEDWELTTTDDGKLVPLVITRGNHEKSNSILVNLFDTPSGVYYATQIGGDLLRVYTLNSEASKLGDQAEWLKNDLEANDDVEWKFAQYHRPMRPHVKKKSEGNAQYKAWAQLFYDHKVRLVIESDSHTAKTTYPLRPSNENGNDMGFVRDEDGTVFLGEGCWGAPLRKDDDTKSWTRASGSFNHFNWIFVDKDGIEVRTVKVDNADEVASLTDDTRFEMPEGIDIWEPETGDLITLQ